MNDTTPGRILGIGGVFLKSSDHAGLRSWYQQKLGIGSGEEGAVFKWSDHTTAWCIFPADSGYFDRGVMVNYIVDDLEAYLAKLRDAGVTIDPKREDASYGLFAWIYDPEGNKIELWQPLDQ
jgi:predicted enzyme related to lactoylglutathione lyase